VSRELKGKHTSAVVAAQRGSLSLLLAHSQQRVVCGCGYYTIFLPFQAAIFTVHKVTWLFYKKYYSNAFGI